MEGDPEKLRHTEADVSDTQPIGMESLRRARMLRDLNEKFSEELSGKSIRYGGNEYEFMQVMLEDGTGGVLSADQFVLVLREKGTEFVAKIDPETFRTKFQIS